MKLIIVNGAASNVARLAAELDRVQSRARVRTVSAEDIGKALDRITARFRIPKTAMEGVRVTVDLNAQKFPNAYNGIPESTFFSAVYSKRAWRVTEMWRGRAAMPNHMVDVVLTGSTGTGIVAWRRVARRCR